MKGPTGAIRITTTTAKGGKCTRDTGTTRTTTTAIGDTTVVVATTMITGTASTAITSARTTDHRDQNRNDRSDRLVEDDVRSGPGIMIARHRQLCSTASCTWPCICAPTICPARSHVLRNQAQARLSLPLVSC